MPIRDSLIFPHVMVSRRRVSNVQSALSDDKVSVSLSETSQIRKWRFTVPSRRSVASSSCPELPARRVLQQSAVAPLTGVVSPPESSRILPRRWLFPVKATASIDTGRTDSSLSPELRATLSTMTAQLAQLTLQFAKPPPRKLSMKKRRSSLCSVASSS